MKRQLEEKNSKIVVKSVTADVTPVFQNTLAPKNRQAFFQIKKYIYERKLEGIPDINIV